MSPQKLSQIYITIEVYERAYFTTNIQYWVFSLSFISIYFLLIIYLLFPVFLWLIRILALEGTLGSHTARFFPPKFI